MVRSTGRLNAAFEAGFLKRSLIPPRRYRDNDELAIAINIISISSPPHAQIYKSLYY